MKSEINILELLDQVQAIAWTGLSYADSEYDRERYRTLLDVAVAKYSDIYQLPQDQVLKSLQQEIGYITPKIGVNAAVFDETGKMLLEKRATDGTTGIPGGWIDPGLSPEATVKKELLDETGLTVEIFNSLVCTLVQLVLETHHTAQSIFFIWPKESVVKFACLMKVRMWDFGIIPK